MLPALMNMKLTADLCDRSLTLHAKLGSLLQQHRMSACTISACSYAGGGCQGTGDSELMQHHRRCARGMLSGVLTNTNHCRYQVGVITMWHEHLRGQQLGMISMQEFFAGCAMPSEVHSARLRCVNIITTYDR